MSPSHIDDINLDSPIEGHRLEGARTLREALGTRPTIVLFVRHFGHSSAGATSSCSAPSVRPGTTYRSSSFTREAPTRARSSSRSAGRRRVPSPTRADACMRRSASAGRAWGSSSGPRSGAEPSARCASNWASRSRWATPSPSVGFPRSRRSGARRQAGEGRGHAARLRRPRADCRSARVSRGVPVPRKPEGAGARSSSVPAPSGLPSVRRAQGSSK